MDVSVALSVVVAAVTVVAVVLDSSFMWPQAIKIVRTRDVAGVSALTWTFGTVFSVMWAAYAAVIGLVPLFVSNVACTVAAVLAMWAGTRAGWPARYVVWSVAGSVVAVVAAVTVPFVVVTVLTAGAVLFAVPQFVQIVRAASVSGVSSLTWWLNVAVSTSWLIVALYEQAWGVVIANTASIAALSAVLFALTVRRRKEKARRSPGAALGSAAG